MGQVYLPDLSVNHTDLAWRVSSPKSPADYVRQLGLRAPGGTRQRRLGG